MKLWFPKINKIFGSIWPAILWSALIFIIQMVPEKNLPHHTKGFAKDQIIPVPFFDKFIHLFFYSVLTILWLSWMTHKNILRLAIFRMLTLALGIFLYGVLIEYLQVYIGRDFNYQDITANMIGILTGILTTIVIERPRLNK